MQDYQSLHNYENFNVCTWLQPLKFKSHIIYNTVGIRTNVSDRLHSTPNIVRAIKWRRMRCAWHVAGVEERRGVYRAVVGKPEGNGQIRRPRSRWEDNIKMHFQEVG